MFLKPFGLIAIAAGLCVQAPGAAPAQDFLKKALGVLKSIDEIAPGASELTRREIADGLREALRVGTERVVAGVGRRDGYNFDRDIHIPLPDVLRDVQSALAMVGMGDLGDDLELKLNRAAETAAPMARDVFWESVSNMTMDDVMAIYEGPDDAATRYFQRTMTPPLIARMRPIINDSLSQVGAVRAYDDMMGPYKRMPLVPDVKAYLTDYAVEKALDGLFFKLAEEEAAIRRNPAKRTTELLQRVFGPA
jgi:hypothetical protein